MVRVDWLFCFVNENGLCDVGCFCYIVVVVLVRMLVGNLLLLCGYDCVGLGIDLC